MDSSFPVLARTLATDKDALPTLRALRTIVKNVCDRPYDEKFRTLRLSNESVQQKLIVYPAAVQFLRLLGFVEAEGYLSLVNAEAHLRAKEALVALDGCMPRDDVMLLSSPGSPKRGQSDSFLPSDSSIRKGVSQRLQSPPLNHQRLVAPAASWQDVCGQEAVKRQFADHMAVPPLGEAVLLYGPAGSGKTLVAHAAAHAWSSVRVLTAWGTEVQTSFAVNGRQRASGIARLAAHATEVSAHGLCVILLRGMDCVLPAVVRELRQALGPSTCQRIVFIGTCTSTEALVVADRTASDQAASGPILTAGRVRPHSRGRSSVCQSGFKASSSTATADGAGNGSGLSLDELACFEHLMHVPSYLSRSHDAELVTSAPNDLPKTSPAVAPVGTHKSALRKYSLAPSTNPEVPG
jgi:hypothetical protein